MKTTIISYLLILLPILTVSAIPNHPDSTDIKSHLTPENEQVTYISYRRDRTAILRIDRHDQQSMIARVPLIQSQINETEFAGEVSWGRPRSGFMAHIVDKPDGMECILEKRRTRAFVECWNEEADEVVDEEKKGEWLFSEVNRGFE